MQRHRHLLQCFARIFLRTRELYDVYREIIILLIYFRSVFILHDLFANICRARFIHFIIFCTVDTLALFDRRDCIPTTLAISE